VIAWVLLLAADILQVERGKEQTKQSSKKQKTNQNSMVGSSMIYNRVCWSKCLVD
jgi:hypothetical protein